MVPLVGALIFLSFLQSNGEPLLKENDHLAFIGDQLTSDLGYTTYVEDYLLACQPVPGLDIAQFGWVAATPDAFVPKIDSNLAPFKPTVATILFASDGKDGEARRARETSLIEALKKSGVRTIVLGSPMCADSFFYNHNTAQGDAYNQTLLAVANADKDLAAKEGVVYADVFGATLAAMKTSKEKFGEQYPYDPKGGRPMRVHYSLVTAYAFLKALGCDGNLGTITADFAGGNAEGTPGHTVVSFADQVLMVQSGLYSFSYPGLSSLDPFMQCVPFNQDLNRLTLIVKNLPTASAKIIWNDNQYGGQHWHDFTAAELAQGVNLADVIESPFTSRFIDITSNVCDQLLQQQIAGLDQLQGTPNPAAEANAKAALANAKGYVTLIPYKIVIETLVPPDPKPPGPVPIIVDTDMNGDVDDAGAVALINSFAVQGEAMLLACVVNAHDKDLSSGAVCKAIDTYYGHGDVPIGAYHGPGIIHGSTYTLPTHKQFCPDFPTDDKLPAGVDVYRKALASASDGSVVIVSIGLLQNIEDLENSKPDAVSNLNGIDLIKKKVRKLVIMANTQKTDQHILDVWPTPILWTTYVGTNVGTGKALIKTPETNPVRFAYGHHGPSLEKSSLMNGRGSWDLTAAWLAVRGPGELWDIMGPGSYRINPQGGATWVNTPGTKETLATFKMPTIEVTKIIDAELARPPKP